MTNVSITTQQDAVQALTRLREFYAGKPITILDAGILSPEQVAQIGAVVSDHNKRSTGFGSSTLLSLLTHFEERSTHAGIGQPLSRSVQHVVLDQLAADLKTNHGAVPTNLNILILPTVLRGAIMPVMREKFSMAQHSTFVNAARAADWQSHLSKVATLYGGKSYARSA